MLFLEDTAQGTAKTQTRQRQGENPSVFIHKIIGKNEKRRSDRMKSIKAII